jgi:hypothetical protein
MKQLSLCFQKVLALATLICLPAGAQVNVLTYHNDNSREGANLSETILTPANVNQDSFGKLFSYGVDGYVYAQPLYVSGLNIAGQGAHNVIFVATEHNSVYAFDADSNAGDNGGLLWHVNLGTAVPTPNPDLPFQAIQPEVGITGTPVIDLGSQTLYVDAFTWDGTNFFHHIHALNLADGSEQPFSPVLVSASVPGHGNGSTNGIMPFQAGQQLQRAALTLAGGVLYVCFAGFTDTPDSDPYHGWVLGYDAASLQLLPNYILCTTPNGTVAQYGSIAGRGSIWMGGDGPAVDDANNLYFATGDGNFNAFPGSNGTEYADSYLKVSTAGGLSIADYFTPNNAAFLQAQDLDAGSGGVMLLPDQPGDHPHLMIGAGKSQRGLLIDRDQFTTDNQHFSTNGVDQVVQIMPLGGGSFDTPAYFDEKIYYGATKDSLRYYVVSNGTMIPDLPHSAGTRKFAFPGTTPSISANGNQDGILWAIQNAQPAVLVAYDATNLSTELYNSSQAGQRDQLTGGVKFVVPTIANGKVYAGSQNALTVFGLLDGGSGGSWKPITANYKGLFFESSGAEFGRSGKVNLNTTRQGKYSGIASLGSRNVSFHGKFDANGADTTAVTTKSTGTVTFNLQVSTTDNNSVTGTIDGDGWEADFIADRDVFNKKSNPAPFAGTYNITFPGPNDGDPTHPQDDGTGTITVNLAGQVNFRGRLGDGTKVSQSSIVSVDGNWPFYIPLYNKGGEIVGWLNFDGSGDVGGQTTWIRLPHPHSKSFPGGFQLNPVASGATK